MIAATRKLNKQSSEIQRMFSEVAPRYDLLNRLLSARRDVVWRRAAAAILTLGPGDLVLDICCGTGDQALASQAHHARVVATDFSLSMLRLAEAKFRSVDAPRPRGVAGDSLRLPLPAARFTAVTVSFGLRNVEHLEEALTEMFRILQPGGKAAILEFATPTLPLLRQVYLIYFQHILPVVGGWLSPRGSAYRYLADSVMSFPQRSEFTARMQRVGFVRTAWRDLSGGIVCLYTGARES